MIEQDRLKRLWEVCGVKPSEHYNKVDQSTTYSYDYLPPTLDNLFEWAVHSPKLKIQSVHFDWGDNGCLCWIYTNLFPGKRFDGEAKEDAEALFEALYKVLVEEKQ
jgi:hypothetical protein